jgi:exodeoxyribonuclease VIII
MKAGVYRDISNADYHDGEGISKSGLDLIARSPMHYHSAITSETPRESTPAQMLGTALHCMVLEPNLFLKEYTLSLRKSDVPDAISDRDTLVAMIAKLNEKRLPKLSTSGSKAELIARIKQGYDESFASDDARVSDDDLSAMKVEELKEGINLINAGRSGLLSDKGTMPELAQLLRDNGLPVTLWADVQAEWHQNNGHRKILSADQWDQLVAMRESIMRHPAAKALLSLNGQAEKSVYWTDPETGELCRCRPDFWADNGLIIDLKTTEDASPEGFAKSIVNYRYHVQAPFYIDGVNHAIEQAGLDLATAKGFLFIAVEKRAPYAVGVYALDQDSIDIGRALYRRDLATYAQARASGVWSGYGNAIQSITVPAWEVSKNAHLLNPA